MKFRTCESAELNTGGSACPVDWGKIKGAILVEHGQKITGIEDAENLRVLCHADRPTRILPIKTFVEYAKNGGEAQISAVGYGPNQFNGLNPQTDTFTLPRFDEMLNSELLACANKEWDVYYWDNQKNLIGYNDGTDALAGIPMSAVYPGATPFSTSGAKSTMTVNFAYTDPEDAQLHFDYIKLDYDLTKVVQGLTEVKLVGISATDFKIVECTGLYDRTPEFGSIVAEQASSLMTGVTSATFVEGAIKIVKSEGPISLKSPAELYRAGVKWIEWVKTEEFAG